MKRYKGISERKANAIAAGDAASTAVAAHVSPDGDLCIRIPVDIEASKLRRGRRCRLATILTEPVEAEGQGQAQLRTLGNGGHVAAVLTDVWVPKEKDVEKVVVKVAGEFGDLADRDVVLVSERVKSKVPLIILLTLITLALIIAFIIALWGDPNARKGHYDGKTKEEIQADLDADVDWYSMVISVASAVDMREGETECELRIENVEANHCDQKFRVFPTDDPDDVLYESGAVRPGEYIQKVTFAHALPVGRHDLTVEIQGYESDLSIISEDGRFLSHNKFGASCAAVVTVDVHPANVDYERV